MSRNKTRIFFYVRLPAYGRHRIVQVQHLDVRLAPEQCERRGVVIVDAAIEVSAGAPAREFLWRNAHRRDRRG